jgi:hypothetical protein
VRFSWSAPPKATVGLAIARHASQLDLIFDRKSNYMNLCLLVENVAVLVAQREAGH